MALRQLLAKRQQVVNAQGAPLAGGSVYLYEPNTTNFITAFQDSALTVAHANPIKLSGSGRAEIWITRDCDVQIKNRDGNLITEELNANPNALGTTLSGGLVPNGSFEIDDDADTIPDGWTSTAESTGRVVIDDTDSTDGSRSIKFTSVGDGGGTLTTSDYFAVNESTYLRVDFDIKSSAAAVHNLVRVQWYDEDKTALSNFDVYDEDTSNPTSWTAQQKSAQPPASARFAKLELIGCDPDTATHGSTWFDRVSVFYPALLNFDFVAIDVAGAGDFTLDGVSELDRIVYDLTGALTAARNLIVPAKIQQYWVHNATSGAFTLTVKTASGTGVEVPQGTALILYCDGTNVVAANSFEVPLPVADGGTGLDTWAQGDLLYASAADTLAALAKSTSAKRYLANTGPSNAPAWAQVDLSDGVTGDLPLANIAPLAGLSVLGRSANTAGDMAAITSPSANQVLRATSTNSQIGFGALNLSATAATVGQLPATRGGTGLAGSAAGDLLVADAADSWASLARATTGVRYLSNQGASNAPAWSLLQLGGDNSHSTDYTFVLDDMGTLHTSGSTTALAWTVPSTSSVAWPNGAIIALDLRSSSGDVTLTPGSGVSFDNHTGSVVLTAGYKGLLIHLDGNIWGLLPNPTPSDAGRAFGGYVDSAATSEIVPSGWSAAKTATGKYTVTHNLGLGDARDLAIAVQLVASVIGGSTYFALVDKGTDSFTVETIANGAVADSDFMFTAVRVG